MGESELWYEMVTKSSEESIVSGEVSPRMSVEERSVYIKEQYI